MSYTPDAHLIFRQTPATDGRLVFGEGEAPQSARATIALSLALPPLKASLAVDYDNRVQRGPARSLALGWQVADTVGLDAVARHASAPRLSPDMRPAWQNAASVEREVSLRHGALPACPASGWSRWQSGAALSLSRREAWALLVARPEVRASRWQAGTPANHRAAAVWRELDHGKRLSGLSRWQTGRPAGRSVLGGAGVALTRPAESGARWQNGMPPRPGRRWVDPVIPLANPCYTPDARLVFKAGAATDARLVFVCENAVDPAAPKKIVPVRRAYIVINEVSLRRADGAAVLRAPSLNLGIDADSWNWSWDAQIDARQLDAVMPDASGEQVELIARLNGAEFRLLVEAISRDRSFEKRSLKISGRGVAAGLAAPYWPARGMSNESDRTMQQLGLDALTINGVSSGWGLDWQAADWLVPAGLWACVGTPVDGLLRLAEAAGAYVQADSYEKTFHVRPRYPVAPWDFASTAPDLQIPESVFVTDSLEWLNKTAYNAVYVSGDAAGGVLGRLKRTGTAGDVLATMITDSLCTHADAVTARGLPVLADTGRQARVTGTLQVLPESGIVPVGSFIQIGSGSSARRGLVRAVRLSAGLPKLRQTLEVECHG